MAIQEGAGNVPQQAFVQWNDPQGTRLAAVNRDGTVFCQGITGINPPQILGTLDAIGVNTVTQTLSFSVPTSGMYLLSLYANGYGTGSGANSLSLAIAYTDSSGARTFNLSGEIDDSGTFAAAVGFGVFPVYAVAGSTITVTPSFDASPFKYSLSVRVTSLG